MSRIHVIVGGGMPRVARAHVLPTLHRHSVGAMVTSRSLAGSLGRNLRIRGDPSSLSCRILWRAGKREGGEV